jgi:pyruvate kinase
MNVMRLNFSHGSYEFHGGLIANLRESCAKFAGPPVAIALDTKGPEIRTGMKPDEPLPSPPAMPIARPEPDLI